MYRHIRLLAERITNFQFKMKQNMYVSKKDREKIKQKFGGKCAYTGY